MKTLIVPTVTVFTAARVSEDLLETGLFVKVTRAILVSNQNTPLCPGVWFLINYSFPFSLTSDIDECSAVLNPCDEKADCSNTDGSYSCTCKQGFTGDGSTCEGTTHAWLPTPDSVTLYLELHWRLYLTNKINRLYSYNTRYRRVCY